MNQIKFLWLSRNIPNSLGVVQTATGITIVKLHKMIDIIHNYKKNDKVEIIFKDTNDKFIIPNQKVLEEIYRIHLNNSEALYKLHQYCEQNLSHC